MEYLRSIEGILKSDEYYLWRFLIATKRGTTESVEAGLKKLTEGDWYLARVMLWSMVVETYPGYYYNLFDPLEEGYCQVMDFHELMKTDVGTSVKMWKISKTPDPFLHFSHLELR